MSSPYMVIQPREPLVAALSNALFAALHAANPGESVGVTCAVLGQALGCERSFVFEVRPDGTYANTYEWCREGVDSLRDVAPTLPDGLVDSWFNERADEEIVAVRDLADVRDVAPRLHAAMEQRGVRSLVAGKLMRGKASMGILGFDNPPAARFADVCDAMGIACNYLCSAINSRNLVGRLRSMGVVDRLTGAGSRNLLYEKLEQFGRDESIGVVYTDVFGLRAINEIDGHAAGDQVLVSVRATLAGVFGDRQVYRMGGDEFAVVCPAIPEDEFASKVSTVSTRLARQSAFVALGSSWQERLGDDFDVMVRRADMAMLSAKTERARRMDSASGGKASSKFDEMFEIRPLDDTYKLLFSSKNIFSDFPTSGTLGAYLLEVGNLFVHPDDRKAYFEFWNLDLLRDRLAAETTGDGVSTQYRYRIPGGGYGRLEERVVVASNDGEAPVLMDYIRDLGAHETALPDEIAVSVHDVDDDGPEIDIYRDEEFHRRANVWLSRRTAERVVAAAFDINYFKLYNDIYGREAGDQLLELVAGVLGKMATQTDGVAGYLGGDNFCLLFPYPKGMDDHALASLIEQNIRENQFLEGFAPACGVCVTSDREAGISMLYDRALVALGGVKGNYTRHVSFYDEGKYEKVRENQLLLIDAQNGLKNGEFTFYLQPKVDLRTGRIISSEALVRWIHGGEIVAPFRFIPSMEKSGYIFALDRHIWERVCQWQRSLLDRGIQPLPVSVNVSRIDFYFTNIAEHFVSLLAKYDLDPRLVSVEITESAYSEETALINKVIDTLQSHGFLVLMDDFGSGYSSLNMLRSVPVDVLKIDKSFLDNSSTREGGDAIIGSVIDMAHTLHLPVITEGVETAEQRDQLRGMGCDFVQGYFYYKPMPIEEYEKLLADPTLVQYGAFGA